MRYPRDEVGYRSILGEELPVCHEAIIVRIRMRIATTALHAEELKDRVLVYSNDATLAFDGMPAKYTPTNVS